MITSNKQTITEDLTLRGSLPQAGARSLRGSARQRRPSCCPWGGLRRASAHTNNCCCYFYFKHYLLLPLLLPLHHYKFYYLHLNHSTTTTTASGLPTLVTAPTPSLPCMTCFQQWGNPVNTFLPHPSLSYHRNKVVKDNQLSITFPEA